MSQARREIVVTSMGVVSCAGPTLSTFEDALMSGRCCLSEITRLKLDNFPYRWGGQVDVESEPDGPGRAALVCRRAATEALGELGPGDFTPARAAIVSSTNFGPMDKSEAVLACARDGRPVSEELFASSLAGHPTQWTADALGFRGLSTTLSLSCASGGAAIGWGGELIRQGKCDLVLAGGYDLIELTSWAGLGVLRVMIPTPKEGAPLVRPFDKNRGGTLFSEGAAFLLLESARHAQTRGAEPLATLSGWATNNNAYHMTHADPGGEATAEVMSAALKDARLDPARVDHINAHGTGTELNDKIETSAIRLVFGDRADRIPVTSIKGTIGHGLGAAGAFEAVAALLALRRGRIPPTINYETPDPDCDLDIVANTAREAEIAAVLTTSAGIGGCNSAVVFQKA